MLAVNDPAADVTSTQTWQAAGDGRATGIWTAPPRPAGGPESPGGVTAGPGMPEPGSPRAAAGRPGDTASHADEADGRAAESARRGARGHSGTHTSPHSQVRAARPDDPQRPAGARGAAGTRPRRKRPASVKLAMATALVLVLAAAAALSYAVLRNPAGHKAAAPPARKPASSPSASPSPSLGPYGHIASRKADPTPLTTAELYPVKFTAGGTSILRTTASTSTNCAANLVGSGIQAAIGSAGCSQVVRATYLASASGLMGTIGVLNLSTAKAATTAARAADASDFISQLAARHGPTHKIGQGTGIEEAAAKGHYLILIWAEFTDLRKPRAGAQRTQVEQFMTELLQNTANVSLSRRLLTGNP